MSTEKNKGTNTNAGIRRILCATDLSGNCDQIYSCAMNLAGERDANLMVIHVLSKRSIKLAKTLAYYLNESQKDIVKKKAYSALHRMREELGAFLNKELKDHPEYPDLIEHLLVYPGQVAEEIAEKSNRFGCEAIVLGSHGNGFLKRFFSCGTTRNVLKRTQKPVFLVSMKKGKLKIKTYNNDSSQKEMSENYHANC
jgi:nucleotide-binding universal stress UspA family protein